jgi:hypothetical protein
MPVNNTPRSRGSQRSKTYQWLGRSLADVEDVPPSKTAIQLRDIGKRAHREGGREKMLVTFRRLKKRGISVGYAWDGIGGWYK